MQWFLGEVSQAIQKAIQEKKVFLVFIKGENEDSKTMEELLDDDVISQMCSKDKCVAINISADSISGQQFASIYPILCLPSTYLINSEGMPTEIIPGVLEKEEFLKRLKDGIQKALDTSVKNSQQRQDKEGDLPEVAGINSKQSSIDNQSSSELTEAVDTTNNLPVNLTTNVDDITLPNTNFDGVIASVETETSSLSMVAQETPTTNVPTSHDTILDKMAPPFSDTMESEETVKSAAEDLDVVRYPSETSKERAARLLERSRAAREKKEKEKQKELERKGREEGVELARARRDMAERQAKKLADEITKEREEEKAAREKVLEQIRHDKAEKAARYEKEKQEKQKEVEKKNVEKVASDTKARQKAESTSRIQFRLPDGSTSVKQFDADAKFLVVVNHAEQCVPDLQNIRLTIVYPKHEFTRDDYMKSLRELNLVPSAAIIVSRGASQARDTSSVSLNPLVLIMAVLAPVWALFKWLLSLFTESSSTNQIQQPLSNRDQHQDTRNDPQKLRDPSNLRRRIGNTGSNIRQIRHDDDDDNENGTWNGNSTQQM